MTAPNRSRDLRSAARRRRTPALVVASLCCALVLAPAWAAAETAPHHPEPGAPDGHGGTLLGVPRHSSDSALREGSSRTTTSCPGPDRRIDRRWQVARGIKARTWDRKDSDRKPIRVSVLRIKHDTKGIRFDYLGPKRIGGTQPTSRYGKRRGEIAAVNADFFDISDTGAPLGMGVHRRRGVLHGTRTGWVPELGYQPAFWVKRGNPHISALKTQVRMKQHPRWKTNALNSPRVPKKSIGVYNRKWGRTSGRSVTGGNQAREVVIENGRVVRNRWGLSKGMEIRGAVLVGRGDRARQLRRLDVGDRVNLTPKVRPKRPRMAISGDRFILRDGERMVVNDALRAPRTAVGIDHDRNLLFLMVVDGRQSFSCGATMVQMARLMRQRGVDDALNLDGGGSTTMWTERPSGSMGVINSPSDGSQRHVANALGVHYRRR